MPSTKAHIESRWLHSYVMLSSVCVILSKIKTPSVEQIQLCCIMSGGETVKFHHLPNSVWYSTYKLQSDLFQCNCRNWLNIVPLGEIQLSCGSGVTLRYRYKSPTFYLMHIFI